jgi:hypothetical protein
VLPPAIGEFMSHRYKPGQKVRFSSGFAARDAASGEYEVLCQLPPSDGQFQYRVRSPREPYERVVKEDDIEKA